MTTVAEESISNRRNIRKAAVIIASLGTDLAAQVCTRLNESLVRAIADEVAHLDSISTSEYRQILEEFSASALHSERLGGLKMAQELLDSTLGSGHSQDLLLRQGDGLDRLRQLADMDPQVIARRLDAEMPQTAAVLISQLSAAKAAAVLQHTPEERRAEIMARAATIYSLAPGTLQALADGLEEMFVPTNGHKQAGGDTSFSFLMDIIINLDRTTQEAMLEDLEQRAPDLAARIEQGLFTFDDLLRLPDRALQTVLRSVDTKILALALKGLEDEDRARVTENLSERANQALAEEMEVLGPVRVTEVEEARAKLAATARELEEQGEISIDYGEVSYIE